MKNMFRTRYRICKDNYAGYEVQYRLWWLPYYIAPESNTFARLEDAERFIEGYSRIVVKEIN